MITIVIPTMWKFKPFQWFLPFLINSPSVGQVIIIDNNHEEIPDLQCLLHSKVNVVTPYKNLYVNPSWNLGVNMSTHEKVCVLSDDVIVDPRLFIKADDFLNDNLQNIGILGACPGDVDRIQPAVTTGEIDIVKADSLPYVSNWGFGSCFFILREYWTQIPETLKIWYGDVLQWETQLKLGRTNYLATNLNFYSPWNVTVKSLGLTENLNIDFVEDKFYNNMVENK